jgi:hypothetical protein
VSFKAGDFEGILGTGEASELELGAKRRRLGKRAAGSDQAIAVSLAADETAD